MIAEVKFKEFGSDRIGTTSYSGENLTRSFIIDFFGLNQPDITWFDIKIHD